MSKALSVDLRDRVVTAIEGGLSCRQAALRFGVSASSAIRWRMLARTKGDVRPGPLGGDRRSGRIEAHAALSVLQQDLARINPKFKLKIQELQSATFADKIYGGGDPSAPHGSAPPGHTAQDGCRSELRGVLRGDGLRPPTHQHPHPPPRYKE